MTVNFEGNPTGAEPGAVSESSVDKVLSALQQPSTAGQTAAALAAALMEESGVDISTPPPAMDKAKLNGPTQYTDGYTYEVPRPFLTLEQAAAVLGKSLRSIERSLLGRWGNKLPEGWVARKIRTEKGDQWRILPPQGFRVKLSNPGTEFDTTGMESEMFEHRGAPANNSSEAARRRQQWLPERHSIDQPAIVIERTEEVEYLLRELVAAQKALSEERRLHLDDMRMINQMQTSMRLLEVNAVEQSKVKQELDSSKRELIEYKEKYNRLISSPWWKRLFKREP